MSTGHLDSTEELSVTRRSDNTHPNVQAAVLWCWNWAPALSDLPVDIKTDIICNCYIQCVKTTKEIMLKLILLTLDSPLYLIPLMNFKNCSKAGLNSPTCITNIVRWFCSTDAHTSLSPQCLTSIRTPSTARPSDLSTAMDILGYLSELKCTTCICKRKEK